MRLVRIATAVNLTIAAFSAFVLAASAYQGLKADTDFTPFYVGWSIVRDGRGEELYDLQTQKQYELPITKHEGVEVAPYLNPPYLVLPFLPLSYLSRVNAARVWLCIQLGFLFLTLRNLWIITAHWKTIERVYMVSAILALPMLVYTLYQGTFSLLILLALTYLFRARKDRPASGVWIVVASIKPQLVLIPSVMLVARKHWRTIISAGVVVILLALISLPFVGWHAYLSYPSILRTVGSELGNRYGAPANTMANFRALLCAFTGSPGLINALTYAALAAAIVFTIYLWRTEELFRMRFALTVLSSLFFAPHLSDQDVLIAALPTVLIYDHVRYTAHRRIVAIVLCCLPALLAIARTQDKRAALVLMVIMTGWASIELLHARAEIRIGEREIGNINTLQSNR